MNNPATECSHPYDELRFVNASSEDAYVGSPFPRKVYFYACNLCGAELHYDSPLDPPE